MTGDPEQFWQPLSPAEIAALFRSAEFPWWIAGGYAIEHAIGRSLRPHVDIDLLVLRRDQLAVQSVLTGWDCWASDPPGSLRPWRTGEVLPPDVTDIWCRWKDGGPWRLQIMLDDGDEVQWRSRRNPLVTKPTAELSLHDAEGIPYLSAEVQLFYKAKAPRPKDELDFLSVLPFLNEQQRAWLRAAILSTYGTANNWLGKL